MASVRKLILCLSVGVLALGGCLPKKPYADDPLLHGGRGVWGDREAARKIGDNAEPEPVPPLPPNKPESIDPFLAGAEADTVAEWPHLPVTFP